MKPRRPRRRRILALVSAMCAHLLALLFLGWRIPKSAAPEEAKDQDAAIEVTLVRPRAEPPARAAPSSSGRASSAPAVSQRVLIAPTPGAPALSAPVQGPPAPEVAQGPADCAVEDLPLLTEAEKARCRNEIDADKARRLARGADQKAARQVAEAQRGPRTYRMDSDKEAYYGAVAAAYDQQSHGGPMAGTNPSLGCSVKFSGLKIVKSKPPPNAPSLGPCFIVPPQGFLTEESGIRPP